jgi:signal peptidase I
MISNVILVIALVVIWITFAPVRFGGKTSYVIVNGISMEPGFHLGDLTIIRKASEYQIGDVVTYRDARMQAYVIHRIIGVDQDRFILRGDNNSWVDAYYPTYDEIVGKLWIYIPRLGKLFKWLQAPLHLSLIMVLLGGALMSGMIVKPSKNGKRKYNPAGNSAGMLESGLYAFGFIAVIFLGLSILFFLRPLTRSGDKIEYSQQSQFSYSATGTPMIYDTEMVRSGEPVFPKLTCFLNVGFTYTFLGENLQSVSGSHQLVARVLDEQSGWQRTIPLNALTTFTGNTFSTTSTLDLCQVVSLVNLLEQKTGLRSNSYLLEIAPEVTVTARAAGDQITDLFEPRLVFRFDDVHFSLFTPKGQDNPLHLSKAGFAPSSNVEANTLSLFRWHPTILSLRVISLLGLACSLSGLLFLGLWLFISSRDNPETLIRLKYGGLLVNVQDQNIELASALVNVMSIDELAKLAERHNTVILHMAFNFLHSYVVQCSGVTYRYVARSSRADAYEIEPAHREMIQRAYDVASNNSLQTETADNDLFGYVLSKSRFEKGEVTETTILRKIQL